MASTKDFADYVTETLKLKTSEDYSLRPMMGEYLVYAGGIYFAGVFDNRFLVKKNRLTKSLVCPNNFLTTAQNLCMRSTPNAKK